jgi:hypothetical protein
MIYQTLAGRALALLLSRLEPARCVGGEVRARAAAGGLRAVASAARTSDCSRRTGPGGDGALLSSPTAQPRPYFIALRM